MKSLTINSSFDEEVKSFEDLFKEVYRYKLGYACSKSNRCETLSFRMIKYD